MIIRVSTLDDERLDAYARLTEAQLRNRLEPEKGIFIAESGKVIERALAGGAEPLSLLMEEKWLDSMAPLISAVEARDPAFPVFVAPREELERLTGFELTRGALGAFHRPPLPSVEDVCRNARRIAVLEDITNHTNIGAIFRSAAALGIDAVLVTPACYDPLYRRAVRVSMGTVFQVPWTRIGGEDTTADESRDASRSHNSIDDTGNRDDTAGTSRNRNSDNASNVGGGSDTGGKGTKVSEGRHAGDASDADGCASARTSRRSTGKPGRKEAGANWASEGIPLLNSLGFATAALALSEDSIPLGDPRLAAEERLALVLGTEGDGLSASTIARCDYTVRIPMANGVDSLNVAAASAVAFWELRV